MQGREIYEGGRGAARTTDQDVSLWGVLKKMAKTKHESWYVGEMSIRHEEAHPPAMPKD